MLQLNTIASHTKALAKEKITPFSAEVDKKGIFPKQAYEALKQEGYMGLLVPKKFGGLGGNNLHNAQACLAIAQYCSSSALCYVMHNAATIAISQFGSKALKEEFLPQIAKGKIAFSIAFSESGHGSHVGKHDIIEKENHHHRILSGEKSFVSGAKNTDFYLTYSNSACIQGGKNLWIIPSNHPNLKHKEGWDGLGMRGNSSLSVRFCDVDIPKKYRVGKEGSGFLQTELMSQYSLIGLSAVYAGISQGAYDCVLEYTKQRRYSTGESLQDIPTIRHYLAELYTKQQSSLSLLFHAAQSFEQKSPNAKELILASRLQSATQAIEICTLALRIGGGRAYAKLIPLERYLRDALSAQSTAPTLELIKTWLSDEIVSHK